jgi:uncharacterized protein (TIGR02757 family)
VTWRCPDRRLEQVGLRLERLLATTDRRACLDVDPVQFPRRYTDPHDIEIAAVVASSLAYGRVAAFRPVLERWFALMDATGGPRAYVERFGPQDHAALAPLVYRWNRGADFVRWMATLQRVIQRRGSLAVVFPTAPTMGETLRCGIAALRDSAGAEPMSRGFRYLIPSPDDGSACKRWNLALRWLVRPEDGVDLGIWNHLAASRLIMPVDTHVGRIARMIGLTRRADDSWKTAEEITANLRRLDPEDPIRFDFALSHLGISGDCRSVYLSGVCEPCALRDVCVVAGNHASGASSIDSSTERQ